MKYKKCPRCELNYIKEGEKLCDNCKKETSLVSEEDAFLQNTKRCERIKAGDNFPLSKNVQLINYLTGSNNSKWPKATYPLSKNYYIWIIALDGKERDGWKDVLLKDGRIKQTYVGDRENLPSNFSLAFDRSYKAVFENNGGSYTFKGVYKLDNENSSMFERYFEKVADETTLSDF